MSRHLLIRCDRAGCGAQTETRANDDAPTSINVPGGWLTLRTDGLPDQHYCSLMCMIQAHLPAQPPADAPMPAITAASPYATPAPVVPDPLKSPPRSRKSAKA